MTDKALADIASYVTMSPDELASVLNIETGLLQTIQSEYESSDQIVQMLMEWRESDDAINLGNDALEKLQTLCLK